MKKVRLGVFETNSSSTHVLVICPKEKYIQFREGKLLLDTNDETLNTQEEIVTKLGNNVTTEQYIDWYCETYSDFIHSELESFYKEYKTNSGEEIVCFGRYGNDY